MPRGRSKDSIDEKNMPYSITELEQKPSLVYAKPILGFDDLLLAMMLGSMSCREVISTFRDIFEKHLLPGIFSDGGLSRLERYRGQAVAVLIAQCPQREATFQVTDGCRTNTILHALIAEVQSPSQRLLPLSV